MKVCPFCAEEIQEKAVKCKHCGSILNAPNTGMENEPDPLDNPNRKTSINVNKEMRIGDRYLIRAKLGEGGMGEVYLTEDAELEGAVRAVKVLPEKLTEDIKAVKRLKEEAQITMELNHNNIVRLFNYEKKEQAHYLVMEYVNGLDLNTYLGIKGKIGEASARRIGIELAEALGVAHGHQPQIIHRDIKPANILLKWPNLDIETISTLKKKGTEIAPEELPDIDTARVKLADFGIARQVRDSMSKYGRMSDTSGTKLYMSPEQIRGKGVDIRTDLYALGATLYELLSGDPPFSGESVEYQIFNEKPDPIEGVSEEMNQILLCLLEKDKEKRYPNAEELILHFEGNGQSLSTGKQDNKGNIRDKEQEQDTSAPTKDYAKIFGGDGYLSIRTDENCEIWIDDSKVGETKDKTIVFRDIKSGKHKIEGRTRYRCAHEELDFKPKDVKRINLELKEVLCDLRAISDGIDYELTIDGKVHECPALIEQIPAGKKTLTISTRGLYFEEELDLLYDRINEYEVTDEKIKIVKDRTKEELCTRIEGAIRSNDLRDVDGWVAELLTLDQAKAKIYQNNINSIRQKIKKDEIRKMEDDIWKAVKDKGTKDAYNDYLNQYPKGSYFKDAKSALDEIKKREEEEVSKYFKSGEAYYKTGEYDLAIEDYTKVIELSPKHAVAFNNRGVTWNNKGNYLQAIDDFTMTIKLNPNDALAYKNRGFAWNNKGNYERAVEDYSRAIELAPKDAVAFNNRGVAWYNNTNYDRASDDYTRAIELDPKFTMAYKNRGDVWIKKGNNDRAIEDYLKVLNLNPSTSLKEKIEKEIRKIEGKITDPVTGIEFIFVEGGCFDMGDVFGCGRSNEKPVHEVCVGDFYISKYPVTQGQWKMIMGNNPSSHTGYDSSDDHPVENIDWYDVQEFIIKLNDRSGRKYRLPTEAEWEYAARSGGKREKYAGTSNDGMVYDYASCMRKDYQTKQVGSKKPNGLGLYDMSGNVWELCADWYEEAYYQNSPKQNPEGPSSGADHVVRGGSWDSDYKCVRVAYRRPMGRKFNNESHQNIGFRLVVPC